jgi:hypothetical protein
LLQLRAVAERHGWAIVAEFVDHGVSGAKGRHERQQFDALLRGVARRDFDMIAAWSVDRLGRSLQDLLSPTGTSIETRRSLLAPAGVRHLDAYGQGDVSAP